MRKERRDESALAVASRRRVRTGWRYRREVKRTVGPGITNAKCTCARFSPSPLPPAALLSAAMREDRRGGGQLSSFSRTADPLPPFSRCWAQVRGRGVKPSRDGGPAHAACRLARRVRPRASGACKPRPSRRRSRAGTSSCSWRRAGASRCATSSRARLRPGRVRGEPLVSLMQDQVLGLQSRGVRACYLGSAQADVTIWGKLGGMQVVYATPR